MITFKIIALIHSMAGLFLLIFATDKEFQDFCFNKYDNDLFTKIHTYIVYVGCFALMACGVFAFIKPEIAVICAWASLACYFLPGLLYLSQLRLPSFCKNCVIVIGVRFLAIWALSHFSGQSLLILSKL